LLTIKKLHGVVTAFNSAPVINILKLYVCMVVICIVWAVQCTLGVPGTCIFWLNLTMTWTHRSV